MTLDEAAIHVSASDISKTRPAHSQLLSRICDHRFQRDIEREPNRFGVELTWVLLYASG